MRSPHHMNAESFRTMQHVQRQLPDGRWVFSRPEPPAFGFWWRLRVALAVFTGKADALYWEGQ